MYSHATQNSFAVAKLHSSFAAALQLALIPGSAPHITPSPNAACVRNRTNFESSCNGKKLLRLGARPRFRRLKGQVCSGLEETLGRKPTAPFCPSATWSQNAHLVRNLCPTEILDSASRRGLAIAPAGRGDRGCGAPGSSGVATASAPPRGAAGAPPRSPFPSAPLPIMHTHFFTFPNPPPHAGHRERRGIGAAQRLAPRALSLRPPRRAAQRVLRRRHLPPPSALRPPPRPPSFLCTKGTHHRGERAGCAGREVRGAASLPWCRSQIRSSLLHRTPPPPPPAVHRPETSTPPPPLLLASSPSLTPDHFTALVASPQTAGERSV